MPHAAADLIEHIGRRMQNLAYAAGLNSAQWTLLRFLARANPSARTLTSFASFHLTTKSTAKQTVDSLLRKHLIRRVAHPEDGRAKLLELTPKGLRTLVRDPMNHLVTALARLPEPDLHQFTRVTATLAQELYTASNGGLPSSGSTPPQAQNTNGAHSCD